MAINEASTSKKPTWKVVIRWVGTVLALAILVYLFYQIGTKETWEQLRRISLWRLALCVVLVFVSRLATWGRWHSLLQVNEQKISWKDSLKLTFAGLFASNVLPTTIGGDVARLAGAVRLGVDGALAAASLVADRLVGMTGMLLVLPFSIPALAQNLGSSSAVVTADFFPALGQKLRNALKKVLDNFRFWTKHPEILLKALGFTLLHMLAIFLIIKLLIDGMGETLPLQTIAGLWSLTYFISLIPISINGLGLQELATTNIFSTLGGLQPATSISLAVILRVLWTLGSVPGVFTLGDVISGKDRSAEEKLP